MLWTDLVGDFDAIDEDETLELTSGLIARASENPPGNERACAELLASLLEGQGVANRLVEIAPHRPNLYASIGTTAPTLVFAGHLDTVPAGQGWTRDPFKAVLSDGKLYGRGACDMKAGLAAMTEALLAVKRSGISLQGTLGLHGLTNEEVGSLGARRASAEEPADWVVVTEPSNGRVLATGNGQLNFEVVFHGRAVHSSHPEDGRNAILDAAAFIRLVEEECARLAGRTFPGIGPATVSVGLAQGGRGGSTVADRCQLTIDRRVLPSENLDGAEAELRAVLVRLEKERPGLDWELERTVAFPPLCGTGAGHLRRVLADAVSDLGGVPGDESQGMRFATDASFYQAAGRAAVVFGPGEVANAHQPDEHVALEDLKAVTRALALLGARLLA